MDLSDLIIQFRTFTKDKSEPYLWEDDALTLWFNEAEREAALRARLLFDKTTAAICQIAVTAGTSVYDLHKLVNEVTYASLTDSDDNIWVVKATDRIELDEQTPYWRTSTEHPTRFIQDDKKIELNAVIGETFTLNMEVYRGPLVPIEDTAQDEPEIAAAHHEHLVKWVMHRAYLINDRDAHAAKLSKQYLNEFEDYFGFRPQAELRKREQINKHHHNKVWI